MGKKIAPAFQIFMADFCVNSVCRDAEQDEVMAIAKQPIGCCNDLLIRRTMDKPFGMQTVCCI